jgi:hypothetical protein
MSALYHVTKQYQQNLNAGFPAEKYPEIMQKGGA